jgi:hypothetical protein
MKSITRFLLRHRLLEVPTDCWIPITTVSRHQLTCAEELLFRLSYAFSCVPLFFFPFPFNSFVIHTNSAISFFQSLSPIPHYPSHNLVFREITTRPVGRKLNLPISALSPIHFLTPPHANPITSLPPLYWKTTRKKVTRK